MLKSAAMFRKSGMVSFWIGHLEKPDQFDEYMNLTTGFENDFGFALEEADVREATVEPSPKPIPQLVDGFSGCDSFAENVAKAAEAAGIKKATTMLICYSFEFDPLRAKANPNAPLQFLGSFPFSESSGYTANADGN